MAIKLFNFFFAFSIAFILQSKFRFIPGIGLGEIGLLLIIFSSFFLCFKDPSKIPTVRTTPFLYLIIFYVLFILFLVTTLNFYLATPGNSFRDYFAYLLSALMLFSLSVHKEKVIDIAVMLVPITLGLITYQYFLGNYSITYEQHGSFIRFTGGANNPNQLALYLVCLISISFIFVKQTYIKYLYILACIFFGLLSFSDAFLAYLLIAGLTYLGVILYPKRFNYLGISGYLLLFSLIFFIFNEQIISLFIEEWSIRDQGNTRLTLYENGLKAWASNPFTIIFGNGAGSFSGFYGPFQVVEAHNGPIDILAMGGLLGFIILFVYPIRLLYKSFLMNERLFFSISLGLLFFFFLHYLMRHPVYWFTLFLMYLYIQNKINLRNKCVD